MIPCSIRKLFQRLLSYVVTTSLYVWQVAHNLTPSHFLSRRKHASHFGKVERLMSSWCSKFSSLYGHSFALPSSQKIFGCLRMFPKTPHGNIVPGALLSPT